MFCGKCGQEMPEGAKVCSNCGSSLEENNETVQEAQVNENQYTAQPVFEGNVMNNSQKPEGSGMAAASLALGIVGIIFAVFFACIGHICSILGIIFGGVAVSKCGKKAGLIVSIIGEILSIVSSVIGVILAGTIAML